MPPLVALPLEEVRLASVPRLDVVELGFSFVPTNEPGGERGEEAISSLRPRLPPFGEEAVIESCEDVKFSEGNVGEAMTVVVGMRNAADGSYFLRIRDGFRGTALVGLADTVCEELASIFSFGDEETIFGDNGAGN